MAEKDDIEKMTEQGKDDMAEKDDVIKKEDAIKIAEQCIKDNKLIFKALSRI